MHSKKELQDMKKSELVELVLKLQVEPSDKSDKAAKLGEALAAAHERIEDLDREIASLKNELDDKDQTIEDLKDSKIEGEEEHKYSAYGRTGLSKEEYLQILKDKSD